MFKKSILSLLVMLFAAWTTPSLYAQTNGQEPYSKRGMGKFVFTEYAPLKNKPITVYYYIPKTGDVKNMRVLFSMHGAERSGKGQINQWRHFAEHDGFVVIAPEYSAKIYGGWAYQFGGVVRKGKVQPREKWTYSSIEAIFDHFKQITGSTAQKYDMFGFSAGGQFTHRFTLAMPDARLNIAVAGNPASWTFPLIDGYPSKYEKGKTYGWGYSVKGTPMANEETIKKFLSHKLYIMIGKLDTMTVGKYVPKTKAALSQGKHRLARARNFYKTCKQLAKKNKWEFNWEKIEVPKVGHSCRSTVYGAWTEDYNGKRRFDINNYAEKSAYYLIFKKHAQ